MNKNSLITVVDPGETAKAVEQALKRAFSAYPNGKRYLTEQELSTVIDIPAATLTTMRCRATGPRYVKRGKLIRYDWNDIVEWMDRHKVRTVDS
jgi:predicted DNA-binding transcriptional regulator AlpA